MNRTRVLLLDLEETIIPVWDNFIVPDPYAELIQSVHQWFKPDRVELFSWAVYNSDDIAVFQQHQAYIEDALKLTFGKVHDIETLITKYNRSTGIQLADQQDFFDFISKERFLFDMTVKARAYANQHIILLDDAVSNYHLIKEDTNTRLDIINTQTPLGTIKALCTT